MRAPSITPLWLKWISMYFPKRLELSFRIVLAFPKADGEGTETVSVLLQFINIKPIFFPSTLLLVFYTLCSKWQHWEALESVLSQSISEERGRHAVHPDNWVLKDIFRWSKCGLYLASQESWACLKTSRMIYWEHVDPCTKMGVSGSSPIDRSVLGQSLCHCLGQMPNQGALPWALQSQGLLCSWQLKTVY